MAGLEGMDLGLIMEELTAMQATHEVFLIAGAILILTGIVIGFFGLKLSRLFSALMGLTIGMTLGGVVSILLDLRETVTLLITLGLGIILAVLGWIFKKTGMFIWMFLAIAGVLGGVLAYKIGVIGLIIGVVIGLIIAILSVKFFEPLVMIATSIVGANCISVGVLMFAGMADKLLANIIAFVVALAICIVVQFSMHSKKLKKLEEGQAKEVRESQSREKEIERARMFLDDEK